ncbi:MAG: hypothetical protein C0433_15290 [Cyclobacterium sp.]|nr:hypothetical protein [Cyclobacterium sp.]
MHNVYEAPEYAAIRRDSHAKLKEVRASYGDSDEMDQKFIDLFNAYWKDEVLLNKIYGNSLLNQ